MRSVSCHTRFSNLSNKAKINLAIEEKNTNWIRSMLSLESMQDDDRWLDCPVVLNTLEVKYRLLVYEILDKRDNLIIDQWLVFLKKMTHQSENKR